MCVIKQGSNKNDYGSLLEYNVIPIYWQKFVVGVTCLGLSPRCWYFPLNDICWPNLLSCVWPRVCHIGCLVRGGGGEGRPSQYCDTLRRLSSGDGWVRCVTCHRHRIQIYIVLLLAVTGALWVLFFHLSRISQLPLLSLSNSHRLTRKTSGFLLKKVNSIRIWLISNWWCSLIHSIMRQSLILTFYFYTRCLWNWTFTYYAKLFAVLEAALSSKYKWKLNEST